MSDSVLIFGLAVVAGFLVIMIVQRLFGTRSVDGRASEAPPSEPSSPSPRPISVAPAAPESGPDRLLQIQILEEDEELELTKLTVSVDESAMERDTETMTTAFVPIVYDDDAAADEPTGSAAYILVHGWGQTDRGKRRKRNEDRYLIMDDPPLFAVADGMGGYKGGDVASTIAVEELQRCFRDMDFVEGCFPALPRRGSELVQAIQSANKAIHQHAQEDKTLSDMGTTVVVARFSPNKQRLYVGHVGDSRCYVYRDGVLNQITIDHTAAAHGVRGRLGGTLTRAVGISRHVVADLIIAKPRPKDAYLICSDGLTKMVEHDDIARTIAKHDDPSICATALIEAANRGGGKDNVTAVLVKVVEPQLS